MNKLLLLLLLVLAGCSGEKSLVGRWQAMPPITGDFSYALEFHQDGRILFYEPKNDFKPPVVEMRVWRLTGDTLEVQAEQKWTTVPFLWVDKNHMDIMGTHYKRVE
jgi:hypothetical protein